MEFPEKIYFTNDDYGKVGANAHLNKYTDMVHFVREDHVAGYINFDPWVLRDVAEKASCDLQIFSTGDVAAILGAYSRVIKEKVNRNKK